MPSLKSQAHLRRRAFLGVHLLFAAAIMIGFAFSPDMAVRFVGVAGSNVYLFVAALLTVRRTAQPLKVAS